ncbi:MAG: hypothetical protein O7C58_05515 [Rickettsia endosymbiont of Ixodes persulcatus]|nr:hypothetical protein [Rickettsia endosymbiont of Ixodes persulcatus]
MSCNCNCKHGFNKVEIPCNNKPICEEKKGSKDKCHNTEIPDGCDNQQADNQQANNQQANNRKYRTFNYPSTEDGDKTLLTGIRQKTDSSRYYVSGFYVPSDLAQTTSFVYKGCLNGKGKFFNLNFPLDNVITNLYGPNNGPLNSKHNDDIQVVGNYNNTSVNLGCLYQGNINGNGKWTTITPNASVNTICHSTMGGLVVGNYDTESQEKLSKAFIYDIETREFFDIVNVNAASISAYGIWHNGGSSYTICGGYAISNDIVPRTIAYVVDWNNETHQLSNWQSYHFENNPEKAFITHFDGITGGEHGSYNLTGDWAGIALPSDEVGFYVSIKRQGYCEKFQVTPEWSSISFPGAEITSGNSVVNSIVIGVYTGINDNGVNGYVSNIVSK